MNELIPTARELMTKEYLAVRPSLGLLEAVSVLERDPEDTAFVVDEHETFLGVLTEKECLRTLAARAYDEAIAETVEDVMCPMPAAIAPTTDAYTLAQAFLSQSCGTLPVLENGRVVGAVSQITMLRTFLAVFRHRTAELGTIEQTADDLKERPTAIEQMQRVFANLNRDQLATLMHRDTGGR
jgi:signal-transduction protein with cAMP-binding, CBS, and nucleotidyltransferase domain